MGFLFADLTLCRITNWSWAGWGIVGNWRRVVGNVKASLTWGRGKGISGISGLDRCADSGNAAAWWSHAMGLTRGRLEEHWLGLIYWSITREIRSAARDRVFTILANVSCIYLRLSLGKNGWSVSSLLVYGFEWINGSTTIFNITPCLSGKSDWMMYDPIAV